MFDEQYRRDNERLHAGGELLMEINKKWKKERRAASSRNRFVRYGAVAAALVLLVGGTVGVLLSQGVFGGAESGAADSASTVFTAESAPRSPASLRAESADMAKDTSASRGNADANTLEQAASYDAIYAVLNGMASAQGLWRSEAGMETALTTDAAASLPEPAPQATSAPVSNESAAAEMDGGAFDANKGGANDYSETNVQVAGVDEADIIKTDGKYIYYLAGNQLVIAEAAGKDTKLLSSEPYADSEGFWGYSSELYVSGDRLMIIMQGTQLVWARAADGGTYQDNRAQTRSAVYDISDRAKPRLVTTLGQSGHYVSSRMADGYVYVITSQYMYGIVRDEPATFVPTLERDGVSGALDAGSVYIYNNPGEPAYTVVSSFALETGTKHAEAKAVLGASGEVYCSGESLILMASDNQEEVSEIAPDENGKNVQITRSRSSTRLTRFTLDKGKITKQASGRVKGTMLNQFAIDEYEGVIRVVTTVSEWEQRIYTDGVDTYEWDNTDANALYTLDLDFALLGSIEALAKDEWVESVRFDGDIAYFVTFRQVDPLFTVDLSDAKDPKLLGALKLPGFSEYLHPYSDTRLLGVGYDADEETGRRLGVKLAMFDVSDKKDVKELKGYQLSADYTMVGENHKSILVSPGKDIIAFPADNSYYIFGYSDEKGFYERARIELEGGTWGWSLRGLFIGECFYVASESGLYVFALSDFSRLASLTIAYG